MSRDKENYQVLKYLLTLWMLVHRHGKKILNLVEEMDLEEIHLQTKTRPFMRRVY